MSDVKVCRICIQTGTRMYNYTFQLKLYYKEIMAFRVKENEGLPTYFCYECAALLRKFHRFREKCYAGKKILNKILNRGPITYEAINGIDREKAMLITNRRTDTLVIALGNLTEAIDKREENIPKVEPAEVEACYLNDNSLSDGEDICDFVDDESAIDADNMNNVKIDKVDTKVNVTDGETINVKTERIEDESKSDSTNKLIINKKKSDTKKRNILKKESDTKKRILSKKKKEKTKNTPKQRKKDAQPPKQMLTTRALSLDKNHWKVSLLNEEEAAEAFKARAKDPKFIKAPFKCSECLKWFMKKDLFDSHVKLKHLEQQGKHLCPFCKYRFKRPCDLTAHIVQHYTRFKCLRCSLECPLENTAVMHDEWHNGITKKCKYCAEEFRHLSTYYTHLRTHRSVHVCTLCGISFVSKLGLRLHSQRKHINVEVKNPDDDQDVNLYCKPCDIRFETQKAYKEHLVHSALHSDDESGGDAEDADVEEDESAKSRYCKRCNIRFETHEAYEEHLIHSALHSDGEEDERKETTDIISPLTEEPSQERQGKRKRNIIGRIRRVTPKTCHQCGEHFRSQAAFMKHHRDTHPRMPMYAPSERCICEICGLSLAPGSMVFHMQRHAGERMYKCETCGKAFYTSISLKRHLLTHSGLKPFSCPLCDKRFTQSNSMKLHYNTVHLKQPYPKRNRRKTPKKIVEAEESSTEESSDESIPDLVPRKRVAVESVMDVLPARTDDDMQYFTPY